MSGNNIYGQNGGHHRRGWSAAEFPSVCMALIAVLYAFGYYKSTFTKAILDRFLCLSRNQRLSKSQISKTSIREVVAHFLCGEESSLFVEDACIALVDGYGTSINT